MKLKLKDYKLIFKQQCELQAPYNYIKRVTVPYSYLLEKSFT